MNENRMRDLLLAATNYYNGRPTGMTDELYDELLREAKLINPNFDIFSEITIGEDRSNVKHTLPFTQQEFKIQFKSSEEFINLINKCDPSWILTPKWDGSSIRCTYLNGELVDIVTRSNEEVGKRKYNQLKNKVPNNIDPRVIAIDFEAVCSKEDFNDDTRSNANGLVNSCHKQDEVDKYLHLIPFKVTCKDNMEYMDAMKLVFNNEDIKVINANEVNYEDRYVEYKGLHYPIDGFVAYKDTDQCHKIYKHYFNQDLSTIVTDIVWNFTDKLAWTPKIKFNPIYLDGRRISQATSNGYSRLSSIKSGIGAEITVILANSTIPQVSKVLVPSEDYNVPKICPFCNSTMSIVNDKVRCDNTHCNKIVSIIISHFLYDILKTTGVTIESELDTIDKFKEFWIYNKEKFNDYNEDYLIKILVKSLIIERFSKHDQLITQLLDHKSDLKNGTSVKNVITYGLTYKQSLVFDTYVPIIDDILQIILNGDINELQI